MGWKATTWEWAGLGHERLGDIYSLRMYEEIGRIVENNVRLAVKEYVKDGILWPPTNPTRVPMLEFYVADDWGKLHVVHRTKVSDLPVMPEAIGSKYALRYAKAFEKLARKIREECAKPNVPQ